MNTFHLHAEDWAWMRQRLRSTGGVMLLLVGLAAAIQLRSPAPHEPGAEVGHVPVHQGHEPVHQGHEPVHQGHEPVHQGHVPVHQGADASGAIVIGDEPPTGEGVGRSVPPSGWRRTSRGWEHVASWPAAARGSGGPSLGERVEALEASEPVWVRHAFGQLRATPPLMVALIQVIAIGVICQLGRRGHHARSPTQGIAQGPAQRQAPGPVPDHPSGDVPGPADDRVAVQAHG